MNKFKEGETGRICSIFALIVNIYSIFDCKHGGKIPFRKPISNMEF
jgi:hypothetical protein